MKAARLRLTTSGLTTALGTCRVCPTESVYVLLCCHCGCDGWLLWLPLGYCGLLATVLLLWLRWVAAAGLLWLRWLAAAGRLARLLLWSR